MVGLGGRGCVRARGCRGAAALRGVWGRKRTQQVSLGLSQLSLEGGKGAGCRGDGYLGV